MDDRRFDELVKNVAEGTSRRGVIQGLVAGVAGAGLTIGDFELISAKKPKTCKTKDCKKEGKGHKCCQVGEKKDKHQECIDTKNDNEHCGGCGNTCKKGKVCVGGKCRPTT